MPDVFISYAREDHERARVLAAALEARGWSVWWDRKIVAGQMFDRAIEQQLESARCVVVLWSSHSISSEWVRNEAGVASERGTFVPALLDQVKQPLEFRRRQAADLTRWSGDAADPEFLALCDGIAAKTRSEPSGPIVPRPVLRDWRRYRSALAIAIGIAALTLGAYGIWRAATAGADGVNRPAIVEASRAETNVDNPQPLALGTVQRLSLDANQEYHLRLAEPAGDIKIVVDMRRIDGENSNLQSSLAVLDAAGAVLQNRVIAFNELGVGARQTETWPVRRPGAVHFRLLNGGAPADFWMIVRPEAAAEFVPLFGTRVPMPLAVGDTASGVLDDNEDAYHMVSLRQGDYQVVVDFASAEKRKTNIQGLVALLDSDGGGYREILRFNEIDVSSRQVQTLFAREGRAVLYVLNTNDLVRYTMRITEAPGAGSGAAADTPQRSLAGRWIAEVRRAGLPPYRFAVDFEQVGDRLLGTVHYPTGDAGVLDGRVSGDSISFRTVHTPQFESTPAEIRFEGRITGETLELVLQDATGAGKVTARRAETEPRSR